MSDPLAFLEESSYSAKLAEHIDLYFAGIFDYFCSWFEDTLKTADGANQQTFSLWHAYLCFVRKTRSTKDPKYISLLGRFTQAFYGCPELKENPKLVQRFIQYADGTNNPIEVYEFMKEKDIGQKTELYYYSYSHALERRHNFLGALEILLLGLRKEGLKKEQLQAWLDEFEVRMGRRIQRDCDRKKRKAQEIFTADESKKNEEPQEIRIKNYRKKLIERHRKDSKIEENANPNAPNPWCEGSKGTLINSNTEPQKSFLDELILGTTSKKNTKPAMTGLLSDKSQVVPITEPKTSLFNPPKPALQLFPKSSSKPAPVTIFPNAVKTSLFADSPKSEVSVVLDRSPALDSAQKLPQARLIQEPETSEFESSLNVFRHAQDVESHEQDTRLNELTQELSQDEFSKFLMGHAVEEEEKAAPIKNTLPPIKEEDDGTHSIDKTVYKSGYKTSLFMSDSKDIMGSLFALR